ncbi:MAG: hypothetical protein QM652_09350 [Legionella sp.]|uniref:hypothetical protein n=1 Tax=Legionella sp. TaxID=459 RepID=UPI0039E4C993
MPLHTDSKKSKKRKSSIGRLRNPSIPLLRPIIDYTFLPEQIKIEDINYHGELEIDVKDDDMAGRLAKRVAEKIKLKLDNPNQINVENSCSKVILKILAGTNLQEKVNFYNNIFITFFNRTKNNRAIDYSFLLKYINKSQRFECEGDYSIAQCIIKK